ncbi:hypothetical protein OC845_003625 [Tilletia horrida]|nr:hypothetical protein OC845_003625 [Tilletia horrida]
MTPDPAVDGGGAAPSPSSPSPITQPKTKELNFGDGKFHGHNSSDIFIALATHSKHMHDIDDELAKLDPDHPHGANDIAAAIVKFAQEHKADGHWPASVNIANNNKANLKDHVMLAAVSDLGSGSGVTALSVASPLEYPGAFSLAALMSRSTWMATVYSITFLLFGLILLFFGYASFYWGRKVRYGGHQQKKNGDGPHLPQLGDGTSIAERLLGPVSSPSPRTRSANGKKGRSSAASYYSAGGAPNRSNRQPALAFPTGIGGSITSALFCVNLTMFITAAVLSHRMLAATSSSQPPPTLAAGAFFAATLLPFLTGFFLLSRLTFLPRSLAGLAGACAITRLLTALFGIHTLLIRIVILAVCALLLAAPLIPLPGRAAHVQRLVCTLATAVWGGISVLDGVVLLILSQARNNITDLPRQTSTQGDLMPNAEGAQAAASWLDTWSLLLAPDGSSTVQNASEHWGTSAFKGCIAASILVPVLGLLFQAVLQHRAAAGKTGFFGIWGGGGGPGSAGKDADEEWNDILGSYTQRYEKGVRELEGSMPANYADLGGPNGRSVYRAGLFEPAPSAWSRVANFFGGNQGPARYGNVGASQAPLGAADGAPGSSPATGLRTLEAVAAASDLDLNLVAGSGFLNGPGKHGRKKGQAKGAKKGSKDAPARFQSTLARDANHSDDDTLLSDGDQDAKDSPPYDSDSDDYDSDSDPKATDVKRANPTPVSFQLPSSRKPAVSGLPPPSSSTPPPALLSPSPTHVSPRPPSYRTNTDASSGDSSGPGSGLSGTTAGSGSGGKSAGLRSIMVTGSAAQRSASSESAKKSPNSGTVPMLITSTRGATTRSVSSPLSPSGPTASSALPPPMPAPPAGTAAAGSNAYVPATPSLVNAISRIQRAQEQARAWHAAQATKLEEAKTADSKESKA